MASNHVLELAQALLHALINREAGGQCSVAQPVGRGQRGVLQAAEQLVDFLLQLLTSIRAALGHAAEAGNQRVVLDVVDQGVCVFDKSAGFHLVITF